MATSDNKKTVEATSISQKSQPAPSKPAQAKPADPQPERQSQLATILIGLLIVASGLLIYNYFQASNAPQTTTVTENTDQSDQANKTTDETPDEDADKAKEGSYTVASGDTLWSIAEKVYGDGDRWAEIEQANELPHNDLGRPIIEPGQVLNVPNSAASTVADNQQSDSDKTIADSGVEDHDADKTADAPSADTPSDEAPANQNELDQTTTYTVVHGDTLWSIAEAHYGDGHQWHKIYDDPVNNLGNLPDGTPLIHAGNVLQLP